MGSYSVSFHPTQVNALHLDSSQTCRCRGKFVAPGKFFPPPYCHNVTNANLNLNPSPNPNPNLNHILLLLTLNVTLSLILTLTRTAACGNNFPVRRIFHYTGTRFTYPEGMEGWIDPNVDYKRRWFTCLQTVTHPSSNHSTASRPGVKLTRVELTTSWS